MNSDQSSVLLKSLCAFLGLPAPMIAEHLRDGVPPATCPNKKLCPLSPATLGTSIHAFKFATIGPSLVKGWENARPHSLASSDLPLPSDLPLFQRHAKLGNHVPECVGGAEKAAHFIACRMSFCGW